MPIYTDFNGTNYVFMQPYLWAPWTASYQIWATNVFHYAPQIRGIQNAAMQKPCFFFFNDIITFVLCRKFRYNLRIAQTRLFFGSPHQVSRPLWPVHENGGDSSLLFFSPTKFDVWHRHNNKCTMHDVHISDAYKTPSHTQFTVSWRKEVIRSIYIWL